MYVHTYYICNTNKPNERICKTISPNQSIASFCVWFYSRNETEKIEATISPKFCLLLVFTPCTHIHITDNSYSHHGTNLWFHQLIIPESYCVLLLWRFTLSLSPFLDNSPKWPWVFAFYPMPSGTPKTEKYCLCYYYCKQWFMQALSFPQVFRKFVGICRSYQSGERCVWNPEKTHE